MGSGIGIGNANLFTSVAGVVTPPGYSNLYSIDFDGVDEYIDLGNNASIRPNVALGVSFSVWAKWVDVTAGSTNIFSNNSMLNFYYGLAMDKNAAGKIALNTGDGTGTGSQDRRTRVTVNNELTNNTWHHIVGVWEDANQANWKIYIDGSVVATTATGTGGINAYNAANSAYIGKRFTTSPRYMDGKLDEIGFWDSVLTASEVNAIYNGGTPFDLTADNGNYVSSSDLIGYWRNGDPNGTASYPTITDDSKNSNNGTMTNMESSDITTDVP
tara:strand:- start:92 stop:904 length:813 start_codon:yes stop_codon:yes gene_type:complete